MSPQPSSASTGERRQVHDIGRRRAWVIWLVALSVYVLAVFHRSSLGVAGLLAADRFGISATQLAFFTVLQLLVYAGMQIPVGVLLDRYGSRRLLLTGLVLMTAGQLAFAFATSFPVAVRRAPCSVPATRWSSSRAPAGDGVVPGPAGADGHPADRPGRPGRRDRRGRAAGRTRCTTWGWTPAFAAASSVAIRNETSKGYT